MKKIISIILIAMLLISLVVIPVTATSNDNNNADSDANLELQAGSSLGTMLMSEVEAYEQNVDEDGGNVIYSITIDNKLAEIRYMTTSDDNAIVVGIFSEDGSKCLCTKTVDVSASDEIVNIDFSDFSVPEYFFIKAFMVNKSTYRPVCTSYESPNYTKEMQDFFAKNTGDFEESKVLNLDESNNNNFAVFNENVKIIKQVDQMNNIVSEDDEKKEYVIEKATDEFKELRVGQIFGYEYSFTEENKVLIAKVAEISADGDTVTIKGSELSMDEVFQYVKIDETSSCSDATVDTSITGEGVEYLGEKENKKNAKNIATTGAQSGLYPSAAFENEAEFEQSSSFSISKGNIEGSLDFSLGVLFKYYISHSYNYFECTCTTSIDFSIGVTETIDESIPLCQYGFDIIPNVLCAKAGAYITLSVSGKVSFSASVVRQDGFEWDSKGNVRNLSEKPEIETELKIEAVIFVGPELKLEINILKIVEIGASLNGGVEISISSSVVNKETCIHECKKCFAGEISAVLNFHLKFKTLLGGTLIDEDILSLKYVFAHCHYSEDYKEFAFNECPHMLHAISIEVVDENNNPIESIVVKSDFKNKDKEDINQILTDNYGRAKSYFVNGSHTINLVDRNNKYKTTTKYINTDGNSKSLKIVMDGSTSGESGSTFCNPQLNVVDINDYVEIIRDDEYYRIPQLLFDTEDARDVNEEIYNMYENNVNLWENYRKAYPNSYDSKNLGKYVVGKKNNIMTICVEFLVPQSNRTTYNIYVIDINTGNSCDNEIVYKNLGYSKDSVEYLVKNEVRSIINKLSHVNTDELIEKTCNSSNIDGCEYCYDENGNLCSTLWIFNGGPQNALKEFIVIKSGSEIDEQLSSTSSFDLASTGNNSIINVLPTNILNGLNPNTEYIVYITDKNEIFNLYSNFKYIYQGVSDENGSVSFENEFDYDNIDIYAVAKNGKDLGESNASVNETINYDSKVHAVQPEVTYGDNQLVFGKDYYLTGDFEAQEVGTYSVNIVGIGDYSGIKTVNYSIINDTLVGDIDGDGIISVIDATVLQRYLVFSISKLGNEKAADVNGDGRINITDVTFIQKHLAGI